MDCYPDAAERFGELRGGRPARSGSSGALNRWLFRRVDVVVGLDGAMVELLRRSTPRRPTGPAFEVIPNWERLDQFPDATGRAVGRATSRSPVDGRTVVLYLGNTGVGHGFGTVLDAAGRARRRGALPVRRRGRPLGGPRTRGGGQRAAPTSCSQGYVPKDDTPAVMAGADLALITLDDRSLGVMSPSKLHANLAAGLPVVYVGPEGSNVDEAIRRHDVGAQRPPRRREGVRRGGPRARRRRRRPHPGPAGLRGALQRRRGAARASTASSTAELSSGGLGDLGLVEHGGEPGGQPPRPPRARAARRRAG